MTPESVIDEMLFLYANLASYQDHGVVLTSWPNKTWPDEIVFRTAFRRPNLFRFEWTKHHPYPPLRHLKTRHVIWSDGSGAYSYQDDDDEIRKEENLCRAIAGAAGISKGSALTVPNLFLPELGAESFAALSDWRMREESFEDTRCYLIEGTGLSGRRHQIWVGVEDYLLRGHTVGLGQTVAREIRRGIQIDHPIAAPAFQLRPET